MIIRTFERDAPCFERIAALVIGAACNIHDKSNLGLRNSRRLRSQRLTCSSSVACARVRRPPYCLAIACVLIGKFV